MMALQVGDQAPDFVATTDSGETVRLSDFRGKKVILYFYPKDDSPGCTTQACGFRDHYQVYEDLGVVLLGISADSSQSHKSFISKYQLPFVLLSDETTEVSTYFGAWGRSEERRVGKECR